MEVRFFGQAPAAVRSVEVTGGNWRVPEEIPVAFVYNGRNYAVMLASPADLSDFAVGFSLTERVVDHADEIVSIDIDQRERGAEIRLSIAPDRIERFDIRQKRRNLAGRAGCGVCGLENAETFFETLPRIAGTRLELDGAALNRAYEALQAFQPLNAATRSVHAAAWATLGGEIHHAREDVGRHNALDKLLGALALASVDRGKGFVLMSSRCSYEIIEKAARLGVPAVASISAPTAFAIRKADEANIAIYARSGDGFVRVGQ